MNQQRRRHYEPTSNDLPNNSNKKIIWLFICLLIIIFIVSFAVSWATKGHQSATQKTESADTKEVNGVKMKLVAPEKQIEEIKDSRPEIEKCTSDDKKIYCTDVADEQSEYDREYIQDFSY